MWVVARNKHIYLLGPHCWKLYIVCTGFFYSSEKRQQCELHTHNRPRWSVQMACRNFWLGSNLKHRVVHMQEDYQTSGTYTGTVDHLFSYDENAPMKIYEWNFGYICLELRVSLYNEKETPCVCCEVKAVGTAIISDIQHYIRDTVCQNRILEKYEYYQRRTIYLNWS